MLINLCLKINATGNPGCTLLNSECTISAGNTLRIGPGDHHRFCEVTSRYVSVCVCQSPRGGDVAATMRRRDRQTPGPAPLRCGAQRVHLQLVNPFLGTIEKLEQRAMFHAPESRADRCPHARHSHLRHGCSPKKKWRDA